MKVLHPQARYNYRVILRADGEEIEIGSIGIQHGTAGAKFWAWGIDNVIPMRETEAESTGKNRRHCMQKFRAAWERFSDDPARLR